MIQSPAAVSFTQQGTGLLVAEHGHRIQLFGAGGNTAGVMAWTANIRPQFVSVAKDGLIAVADQSSQTILFYQMSEREEPVK